MKNPQNHSKLTAPVPATHPMRSGSFRLGVVSLGVFVGTSACNWLPTGPPPPCDGVIIADKITLTSADQVTKLRLQSSGRCPAVQEGDFDIVNCPAEPSGTAGYGGLQFIELDGHREFDEPEVPCGQDVIFCVNAHGAAPFRVLAERSVCEGEEEGEWVTLEEVLD